MNEPITSKLNFVQGSQVDYYALARYHYEPVITFPPTLVLKCVGSRELRDKLPDPLAVLVLIQPIPDITARNKATAGFFKQNKSHKDNLRLLNDYVLYLARLITDPRFLRQGIATYLLKKTLEQLTCPIVETLTPIDFTNNMYVKAGFELHYQRAPLKFNRLMYAFRYVGLNVRDTTTRELIDGRLSTLPQQQRKYIEREIRTFLTGFRNADRFKPGPERTKFILSKVPPPEAYLIWFNPTSPLAGEVLNYRQHPD
jgi:hypothetical protein